MAGTRYQQQRLLGTGGMAEVWLAQGPAGPVALKRLLPHAARNPSTATAFEREGKLLARIRHPNIVELYDVVHEGDEAFLVLEYVEGVDLLRLGAGPVPLRLALRVVHDVLSALETVHAARDDDGRPLGLVHRDLSPSNVLVSTDGKVKLTDFGIARGQFGSNATTGLGIKGTLAYTSPEQATGAPVDARTDLFSVGALLYELVTGRPVYSEQDPKIALARARAGDVRSIAELAPDLPSPIVELCDRALAARPGDRFPDAASMRTEIARVAGRTVGLATEEELRAWSRDAHAKLDAGPQERLPRAKLMRSAIAIGAIVLIGLASALLVLRRRPAAVPPPSMPSVSAPVAAVPSASAAASAPAPSGSPKIAGSVRVAGPPGLLDLGSEPSFAYVTIDGRRIGPTPLYGHEVAPGMHRIEISRDGLGSKTFTVEIRPGQRVTRVVKLP
jgi:serine/threonine protein kinase